MAGYNRNSGGPSAEDKALERFADLMIKKIETISGDWKKPWFTERTAWPRNIYDGKHYDGLNGLMLSLYCEEQGYKIPVFGTFDRFLSFNYSTDGDGNRQQLLDDAGEPLPKVSVNKGEKSFPLYFTSFTVIDKETKEKIKWDDYKKLSAEEQKRYNVFPKTTVWPVFAVEQTNLREARPEMWQKLVEQNTPHQARHEGDMTSHPAIDRMIDGNHFYCPIRQVKGDDAYYSISKDEIVIPLREQFVDGEAFASNALHEMSHATGSEGRLARLKPAPFGSPEYAREELVAELSAAVVSNQYGLDKHIKEDSAAYLKSWLGSLKESPDFIRTTLTDVKKATSMVSRRIGAVQQVLDAEQGRDAAYKAYDDYSQEMSGKYGPEYYDRPEDLAKLLSPEEGAEFEKRRAAYIDAEKRLTAANDALTADTAVVKEAEKPVETEQKSAVPADLPGTVTMQQDEREAKDGWIDKYDMAVESAAPVLRQYDNLKRKHPDALLLFRTGDFYQTYRDDARKASNILGITLTRNEQIKDREGKPLESAGFPQHALDTYLPKLIRAGQRVAICDQLESSQRQQQQEQEPLKETDTVPEQEIHDRASELNASPLTFRMFHGSPDTALSSLDLSQVGSHNKVYDDKAVWLADDYDFARQMSFEQLPGSSSWTYRPGREGAVYDVEFKMEHPLDLTKDIPEEVKQLMFDTRYRYSESKPEEERATFYETIDRVAKLGNHQLLKKDLDFVKLKEMGYDGIIANLHTNFHPGIEYGVFDTSKVRIITNSKKEGFDLASMPVFRRDANEGMSAIRAGGLWGFEDGRGKSVLPCEYTSVGDFHDGFAAVIKDGRIGVVDKTGKEIAPCKYSDITVLGDGFALAFEDKKVGILDSSFNESVPCEYDWINDYNEGYATAKKNGLWGVLDTAGTEIVPFRYDDSATAELALHEQMEKVKTVQTPSTDRYGYVAVGEYYGNEELRSLAHGIKDGDGTAIAKAAALMSPHLPQGSAIVPMPSHEGWPAGTLALCIDLARNRPDITVLPLLHGQPRTSFYDAKRDGVSLPEDSLKMTVTGKVPTDREVFIIDNVIATGETARAAIDAIPSAKVLVLADDVTKEKVWQHSASESRTATLEGNRPDDWRQRYDNDFVNQPMSPNNSKTFDQKQSNDMIVDELLDCLKNGVVTKQEGPQASWLPHPSTDLRHYQEYIVSVQANAKFEITAILKGNYVDEYDDIVSRLDGFAVSKIEKIETNNTFGEYDEPIIEDVVIKSTSVQLSEEQYHAVADLFRKSGVGGLTARGLRCQNGARQTQPFVRERYDLYDNSKNFSSLQEALSTHVEPVIMERRKDEATSNNLLQAQEFWSDRYSFIGDFSEGLATVKNGDRWGFVNASGREVIPCQYEDGKNFFEGLAVVEKAGKWGTIDKSGNEVVPCRYDFVNDFSDGFARVRLADKWGYVDTSGKEVVPCKFKTPDKAESALEKLQHEPEAVKKETVPVSYTDNVVVRHRTEQNDIIGITDERTLNHVLEHDRLYKPYSDIYVDITPIASSIRNGVTSSGSYTAPSKESPDRVQIQPDSFMSGRYTLSVYENDSLVERQSNLTLLQAAEYSTNFAVTHNLLSAIDMPAEPETKSYVILADDNDVIMTPLAEAVRHYTENGKDCLISMFPEKPTHDIHISGNAGVYSLDFKLNNGDVRSYRDLSLGQLMTVTHDVVKNQRDMDMVNDRSRELNTRMMTVSATHPDQSASELSLFFRNLFALHNEAKKTNPQNMVIYRIGQSSIAFEADADRLSEKYGLTVIEDSGQTNAAGAAIRLTVFGSDSLDDYVSGLEKDGLAVDVNELHAGTDRDMSPSAPEEEEIHHGHHR